MVDVPSAEMARCVCGGEEDVSGGWEGGGGKGIKNMEWYSIHKIEEKEVYQELIHPLLINTEGQVEETVRDSEGEIERERY